MTLLETIYERREVVTSDGRAIKLHSAIAPEEGAFLADLILQDGSIARTLEIGCAYGLSSLHICSAIQGRKDAHHTIIDPFQHTDWQSIGLLNLSRSGFDFFSLIEERSEFALPKIAAIQAGEFDLVFVDGMHTFDHTLIDCFFATRLLRVGGYLVIDDTDFPSIARALDHLETYPCYRRCGSVPADPQKLGAKAKIAKSVVRVWPRLLRFVDSRYRFAISDKSEMVALKKVAPDEREWDWHSPF